MKNLIIRTISGIAFTIIMVGGILWGVLPYAVILGAIIALMMKEYMTISVGKGYTLHKVLAIISGLIMFVSILLVRLRYIEYSYMMLALVPIVGIFIANLYVKDFNKHDIVCKDGINTRTDNGYEKMPFIINSILYIALPMSLCSLAVIKEGNSIYSGVTLLSMFIILWATDVGAYCLGSTLGQKYGAKLFPSISPKKSWIGFIGGLICAVLAAVLLHNVHFLRISIVASIGLGIIICIFGVLGDLIESQLKRNFGVKDSGNIMPGHGGMLDRFDGALTSFPIAIIYLEFLG